MKTISKKNKMVIVMGVTLGAIAIAIPPLIVAGASSQKWNEEVATLKNKHGKEKSGLEEKVKDLIAGRDEYLDVIGQLDKQISELKASHDLEIKGLQQRITSLKRKNDNLNEEVKSLNSRNVDLSKEINNREKFLKDLRKQKSDLEQKVKDKDKQISELKASYEFKVKELEAQKDKHISDIAKLEEEISELNNSYNLEIEELTSEREEYIEMIVDLSKEIAFKDWRIAELEKFNKAKQDDIDFYKKLEEKLKKEIAEWTKRLKDAQERHARDLQILENKYKQINFNAEKVSEYLMLI